MGSMADHNYTADSIKSLDWKEHIRLRPGMYIGKLGDGSSRMMAFMFCSRKSWTIALMNSLWVLVSKSKSSAMVIP